jgi:hypothetical protein
MNIRAIILRDARLRECFDGLLRIRGLALDFLN